MIETLSVVVLSVVLALFIAAICYLVVFIAFLIIDQCVLIYREITGKHGPRE